MRRDIVWERADRPGLEHLILEIRPAEIRADGHVLVDPAGSGRGLVRLRYEILIDGGWRTRSAVLSLDSDGGRRAVDLARDDLGRWSVDGAVRPDLDGCADIDIAATPFTNTLPIRQLGLRPDEARRVGIVYIQVPELTVRAVDQEYARLDPAEPPRRFRYRSLASGFVADIEVDGEGFVIDYPGAWCRRSG